MCKITNQLKERFCKDTNLPIKIFDEPYFSERLALYDKQYNCLEKYKIFTDTVKKYGGEGQFIAEYNKLKDNVINYLQTNPKMMFFSQEENMQKFVCKHTGFPKSDIYKETNDGKYFISFDMKKGNFTALKNYSPEIVANKDTYEEFIGLFTSEKHFVDSKYIRQVVFGNVNPRRQTAYEQYLMDTVLTNVLQYFSKDKIEYFSTDEIVVAIDKENIQKAQVMADKIVADSIERNINIRGEIFSLHKIHGTKGYIKKMYNQDQIDIKGVNAILMPIVLRKLYNEDITHNDLVFKHENMTVKLLEFENIKVPENCKIFNKASSKEATQHLFIEEDERDV